MKLPGRIVTIALIALVLLCLPLLGLLTRVPWSRLSQVLTSDEATQALLLSLVTAVCATALALVLGVPLALWLARRTGWMAASVRTLVLVPMVLPPVVAGLALTATLGRRGIIGQPLHDLGLAISFTTAAVVIAQTFVAMPFLVISVEGALRATSDRYGVIAATMGATPMRVFWRVTLPLVRPALISGVALTFARALGEFGATLTFAGSLPGTTRTMPLLIYLSREQDQDLAITLALVLIVVAVVIVLTSSRFMAPAQKSEGSWQ